MENDSLDIIFKKQCELQKQYGFDFGELISSHGQNSSIIGTMLVDNIDCIHNELEELRNCIFWKHWCDEAKEGRKNEVRDVQNARVEVIDILHFFVNICVLLGLDSEDVLRLYLQKNKVNFARQELGYPMEGKTEEDNKEIK